MNRKSKNRYKELSGIIYENSNKKNNIGIECETCDGKGFGTFSCCTGDMVDSDWARCPKCLESLGEEECYSCEGTGTVNY